MKNKAIKAEVNIVSFFNPVFENENESKYRLAENVVESISLIDRHIF
ncbi:MAG: hypothetical protein KDH95_21330 [Calditrichaeota bacterium]|nr:hypothetical protein [Calditrichota bacterium]MCB0270714.1 hypothetical protein [Calditrichota bacterium]MCB9068767.1 hypothetical protein [Calditrichia bacterium]